MRVAFVLLIAVLVGKCEGSGRCPSSQISSGQTSTKGDVPCPSGTVVRRTYNCEPYIDGKERCNPREECERKCNRWCTIFCCRDECKTVYDQCDKTVFRRCSDCLYCVNTKWPTRKPTKRPTPVRIDTTSMHFKLK